MKGWFKGGWSIFFLLAAVTLGGAQSPLIQKLDQLKLLSASNKACLTNHLQKLGKKRSENDYAFLYRIFWSTRKEFLLTYSAYQQFNTLFDSRRYDCLTATTLYATLLEHFGYSFKIIETNYHIFILARTAKGEILLETTDPYNGFVESPDQINRRLSNYRQNLSAMPKSEAMEYKFQFDIFGEVEPTNLPNLLYFNQAVVAFNEQQWMKCAEYLQQARSGYSSRRMKELAALLVQSVLEHGTATEEMKNFVLTHFRTDWIESQPLVVGR